MIIHASRQDICQIRWTYLTEKLIPPKTTEPGNPRNLLGAAHCCTQWLPAIYNCNIEHMSINPSLLLITTAHLHCKHVPCYQLPVCFYYLSLTNDQKFSSKTVYFWLGNFMFSIRKGRSTAGNSGDSSFNSIKLAWSSSSGQLNSKYLKVNGVSEHYMERNFRDTKQHIHSEAVVDEKIWTAHREWTNKQIYFQRVTH